MTTESLIKSSWFYRDHTQKTMFNWALYELALKIYDHIQDSKLKPLQRWKSRHSKKQLAEFSAYYAKRMQVSILENLNGSGIVAMYDIYLTDYCHTNTKSEDEALGKVLGDAWRALAESCIVCGCNCFIRMEDYCEFFDRMDRGGYLS